MVKTWKSTRLSYQECKAEYHYIQGINIKAPGSVFNYDIECFQRYCQMQADKIECSGFRLIAQSIRNQAHITNAGHILTKG